MDYCYFDLVHKVMNQDQITEVFWGKSSPGNMKFGGMLVIAHLDKVRHAMIWDP